MFKNIRRLFFDSGMVLVHPQSGEWFYPKVYKDFCGRHKLPEKSLYQYLNFQRAYNYLNKRSTIKTTAEEYDAFITFYQILFHNLKGKDIPELIKLCADAKVYKNFETIFYDDVKDTIEELRLHYDLGIISDAWPSLLNVYRENGMLKYFEPFIISSMYGCTKQGLNLFKFALENVAEHADECLFIDDSIENCKRAKKLGMKVIVLNRNSFYKPNSTIPFVCSMTELQKLLLD